MTWDQQCDVVIAGSGAAALTAALTTSVASLDTIILEKTRWLGGTSAISAAGLWIPANRQARAEGIDDSPDEALTYIRALAPPGWQEIEDHLWRRLVDEAPDMLAFVEAHSPLRCYVTSQPDPYPAAPGAKPRGRMVSPGPLSKHIVGRYAASLRPPMLPHVFTYHEYLRLDPYHHPVAAALKLFPTIAWRLMVGKRGMGTALITGLLKGCLDHRCVVELDARVMELITDDSGDVAGVCVQKSGSSRRIRARRGVVLATGGFEWNSEMVARYFPGPLDFITSPRGNEGDGHVMAERAGAAMAHMQEANLSPALPIVYDDHLQGLSIAFHQEPNAILVNRTGQRFADEFRFNIGEVIGQRDAQTGNPLHLPAWVITDSNFLKHSPMTRWFARHDRQWMVQAHSVRELAKRINVPDHELSATIERYNSFCAAGRDPDFWRGEAKRGGTASAQDFAPISVPPFLAMPLNRSFVSTKGGPRTNQNGEVLREDGSVIRGLCCAGVAMANPIGSWAVGTGTTLGPNMTWGYVCGKTLAGNRV